MAFNWQTFRTRTLTAVIFAAVMLAGLLWNQWSFLVLFSIIHFGCWWEYLKLTEKICKTEIDNVIKWFLCIIGYIIFLVVGFSSFSYNFFIGIGGLIISLKWALVIFSIICLFVFFSQNKQVAPKAKWFIIVGFLYISVSWGLMLDLSMTNIWFFDDSQPEGAWLFYRFLPIVIIGTIWINDTMAYIVGSLIGKTPLSAISPKKTWEGTIGGIILAIGVVSFLLNNYSIATDKIFMSFLLWIFFALIVAVAGTFGDLLESKFKRMAGVKDSGSIMPGHGGFLDRFDSLLLATPFVWVYVKLLMQ